MKQKFPFGVVILLVLLPGCTSFQEYPIKYKNACWAKWAWHQEKSVYRAKDMPRPLYKHFGKGWRQGYADVANGGSGKVPLLPPTEYWAVRYHNPLGRDEIEAWFEGYQYGALAADQDNVGFWIEIPTSGGDKKPQANQADQPQAPVEEVPAGTPIQPGQPPEDLPPARVGGLDSPVETYISSEMRPLAEPPSGLPATLANEQPAEAKQTPEEIPGQ